MPAGDYIYQIVWQRRTILAWDKSLKSSRPAFEAPYPSQIREGWGLTHDPKTPDRLYWSDGSSYIYTVSLPKPGVAPQVLNKFRVTDQNGYGISQLNELEFINGYIWANIYMTNKIIKIDPFNGKVVRTWDLTTLEQDARKECKRRFGRYLYYGEVLNGIAYNSDDGIWYITGKMWPRIYRVKFD